VEHAVHGLLRQVLAVSEDAHGVNFDIDVELLHDLLLKELRELVLDASRDLLDGELPLLLRHGGGEYSDDEEQHQRYRRDFSEPFHTCRHLLQIENTLFPYSVS